MIGFLRGRVFSLGQQSLLLDVHGIGYEIFMTAPGLLSLHEGEETFIYTYYHQKEDMVALFGFLTQKEKAIFELLTSVSGLGPKTTLGILSNIGENDLLTAIRDGDISTLVRIPGIGNKTAGRIVLELQDKLDAFGELMPDAKSVSIQVGSSLKNDAESALLFLGYGKKEIGEVLNKLMKGKSEADLDGIIRDALKELGR